MVSAMTMLTCFFRRCKNALSHRGGTSAVEFGLTVTFLTAIIVPSVDLGMGAYTQMQVRNAAEAGAEWAIRNQNFDQTAITSAVTGATAISVSANPVPAKFCGCLSGSPASVASASCGTTCADGATAGLYATVNAQATYTPLFPYPVLGQTMTMSAQSTVRYQ
jgi:Flp pilus assembly protein TadG